MQHKLSVESNTPYTCQPDSEDRFQFPNQQAFLSNLLVSKSQMSILRKAQLICTTQLLRDNRNRIDFDAVNKCLGCLVLEAFNDDEGAPGLEPTFTFLLTSNAHGLFYHHQVGKPCVNCQGVLPLGKHPITGATLTRINFPYYQ